MHVMKTYQTRYGAATWCMFCKVTPFELMGMTDEERNELETVCNKLQD